jgi:hypothetical protein
MEIEITETKSYSLNIGGKRLDGFIVASEWNGMTELRRADGAKVIVHGMVATTPDGFRDVFGDIFGGLVRKASDPLRIRVVSASPEIAALLSAAPV